jgi:hypothetical protein
VPRPAARAARSAPGRADPHRQLLARRGLRAARARPPARARRYRVPRGPAARPRLPDAASGAGRVESRGERGRGGDGPDGRRGIRSGGARPTWPGVPSRRSSSTISARTDGCSTGLRSCST